MPIADNPKPDSLPQRRWAQAGDESRDARFVALVLLIVIVSYGAWIRFQLAHESLWLDELHTAWTVSASLGDVAHRSLMGNQSPAYPWLVWCITQCLGCSEITIRLISLVAGTLLVAVGYLVARSWTGSDSLALLVGLLIAIDPHSVYFAQEGRVYALIQLLGVLHLVIFDRLVNGAGWRWRIGWVLLSSALIYLHYTSCIVLTGELTFLLFGSFSSVERRRQLWHRCLDTAFVALTLLPIYWHVFDIAQRRDNWSRFVEQPSWYAITGIFRFDALLVAPLLACGVIGLVLWMRQIRWRVDHLLLRRLWMLTCWLAVPLMVTWMLTDADALRLFFRRYLMVVGAGPMLVAPLVGALLPRGLARPAFCAAVSIAALALLHPRLPLANDRVTHRHSSENWRAAIEFINGRSSQLHWPVFVQSGLIEDHALRRKDVPQELIEFCLFPVRSLYPLRGRTGPISPLPSDRGWELSPTQHQQLAAAEGAWIITRASQSRTLSFRKEIADWLDRPGGQPVEIDVATFGRVSVLGITSPSSHR